VPLLTKHTSNFLGKADVCELYYCLASVPVGHPAGALAIICCWVLLTWLTYAYGVLCQDDIAPGKCFTPPMCIPFVLDWAHQLMYAHDQLLIVISSSGMLAMLGVGSEPSKLWLKLRCYDGFTATFRGIAAPLIIARPLAPL
jgi:hypothetical protein